MLRFSLRHLIRRLRPRARGTIVLRSIVPTAVLTGNLERLYLRVVRGWWEAARDQILPAYTAALTRSQVVGIMIDEDTGAATTLSSVMNELGDMMNRLVLDLTADLSNWTFAMERWHRLRWGANLQPHGVSLKTLMGPEDVGDTLESTIRQNASLVRNVSETLRRAIEQIVYDGFTRRQPARVVARQISEAIGVSRKRALRIVIDQTSKLSADLDTERMKQAGLDEYEWQHSGKVHFRPHHRARDGKIFKWGDIPPEDMPGIPWFCGCKKRAVVRLD